MLKRVEILNGNSIIYEKEDSKEQRLKMKRDWKMSKRV